MGRLIVVSNRVNPPSDPGVGSVGGLAMALAAALRESSGLWFGWSGETCETFTGNLSIQQVGGVTVALVDLEEQDRRILQRLRQRHVVAAVPLFHRRLQYNDRIRSLSAHEPALRRELLPLLEPDDLIWVHDYHLFPLAQKLRKRAPNNPWDCSCTSRCRSEVLRMLPVYAELLQAMLAYDVLGFQTDEIAMPSRRGRVGVGPQALTPGKRSRWAGGGSRSACSRSVSMRSDRGGGRVAAQGAREIA